MEWITQLQGQVVGLDSAPLIYFIEENPIYLEMVDAFFEAMVRGEFRVVTSMVTLIEVLIYPLRQGNATLAQQYRDILFNLETLTSINVSSAIAQEAAQLRASYNLQTPDAIQLATALCSGASFFVTNDVRLPALPGLGMLILEELRR